MIRQLSTPDLVIFVEAYEHYLSSITMKSLSRFGDKAIEKKRKTMPRGAQHCQSRVGRTGRKK